jgi:glycosyltransferase involved in cell wall biosynthesis
MRIGLFTDTYHPQTNGIVVLIDTTRKQLEALGHEVFVICPSIGFARSTSHIIRLPSFPTSGPDAGRTSFFFPPSTLRKIRKLDLDVIHFFTPNTVGLLAVYAANKLDTALIGQHCTDIYHYLDYYAILRMGMFFSGAILPLATHMTAPEKSRLAKLYLPHFRTGERWSKDMMKLFLSTIYQASDFAIAVSRKSLHQLEQLTSGTKINYVVIPSGVDPLPIPTGRQLAVFRRKYKISPENQVVLYVGRLGAEKNIDLLIPTIEQVITTCPTAKLLLVGDNEYRKTLEAKAAASPAASRITFTGMIPRKKLGVAYASGDIYVFPSTTDTQGLVLHEAAASGLPLVIVDRDVTEVVRDGYNGFYARDNAKSLADKIIKILSDKSLAKKFARNSIRLSSEFSELRQTEKLVEIYQQAASRHPKPTQK